MAVYAYGCICILLYMAMAVYSYGCRWPWLYMHMALQTYCFIFIWLYMAMPVQAGEQLSSGSVGVDACVRDSRTVVMEVEIR